MAVPVQFKNMPEHIWASHTFGKSNPFKQEVGGQLSAGDDMTTLKFPGTKNILWDHTSTGQSVFLHVSYYRKPKLNISDKVLRYAQRHTESLTTLECRGLLIGSLNVDEDGEGVSINIDRLHVENTENLPSSHAPGDLLISFQINNSGKERKASVEDYKNAIQLLKERCCSRDAIDLSNFLLTNGWCSFYTNGEKSVHHLELNMVTIGNHFKATPISPVPIVPTALSKNLAGPLSMSHVQGTPKTGYLTMDHTRKLLLVLESDPKICNLPIVGIWISGASFVHNPFVWACCLRYMYNTSMQDRVCSPPEPFLLVLYSPLHSKPEFYECITTSGKSTMTFELYAGYEPFNIYKTNVSSPNNITSVHLNKVDNGPSGDAFSAAIGSMQTRSQGGENLKTPKPANDNDIVPRCIPTPQMAHLPKIQPMVPELSLIMMDDSPARQPASSHRPQHCPEPISKSTQGLNNIRNRPSLPTAAAAAAHGPGSNASCRGPCCQNIRTVIPSCTSNIAQGPSYQDSLPTSSKPKLQNVYSVQNNHMANFSNVPAAVTRPTRPALIQNVQPPQAAGSNHPTNYRMNMCSEIPPVPNSYGNTFSFPSTGQAMNIPNNTQNSTYSQAPHFVNSPKTQTFQVHSGTPQYINSVNQVHDKNSTCQQFVNTVVPNMNGQIVMQNSGQQLPQIQQYCHSQPNLGIPSGQHLLNNMQNNVISAQKMFPPAPNSASVVPTLPCISEENSDRGDNSNRQVNTSNRSSEDSGLSITPERNNSNPNSGKSKNLVQSGSPNSKTNTASSSEHITLQNSNINWNQVPPEIYQLLLQQDSQLKQLQAQIQHLLISQTASSNLGNSCSDSVSQTSIGQVVIPKHMDDIRRTSTNSLSQSNITTTRDHADTCSVATNTTLIYPVSEEISRNSDLKSVSQQTTPLKHDLPHTTVSREVTAMTSEGETPTEIRNRGVLPLNSTQREDSDCVNLSQGDLMAVVNKLAFEKTVDSMHSDMIVDLPSYQSSPVRSLVSGGSGSQGKSASTPSPLSASMYDQQGQDDEEDESDDEETELTDGDQKIYYDKLLSNIKNLLDRHSGEETNESQQPDSTDNISSELPTYVQEKVQLMENIQSFVRYDNQSFNATIVPNINYNSVMFDSDSDCSMEINAMALKYLKDEQLTQLMKLQTSALFKKAKQDEKNVMLRRLLSAENDGTPNVTTMGISPNNLTMGTKQYMEKYGLLSENSCDTNQSYSPLDKTIQLKVDYSINVDSPNRHNQSSPYANSTGTRLTDTCPGGIYHNRSPVKNSPQVNNRLHNENQRPLNGAYGDSHQIASHPRENVIGNSYQQCLQGRTDLQPQRQKWNCDEQNRNPNQAPPSPRKNMISPPRPVRNPVYRQFEEDDNILDIPKLKQLPKLL